MDGSPRTLPAGADKAGGTAVKFYELRDNLLGNDFYLSDTYGPHVLVHETGHTFGLPDLYDFNQATFPYSTFVGDWDIMGSLDVGAGFLAWQRLQLGWIDASQVACFAAPETRDIQLSPIEQAGGTKAIVVQTGPTAFTVAEDRQAAGEDSQLCDSGLLVYTVDLTAEDGHGPIRVQPAAPDDGSRDVVRCGPFYKAAFGVGNPAFSGGGVAMKVLCAVGSDLVVRVAFDVAIGSITSSLCPASTPPPPRVVKPPAIVGLPKVGSTLRVTPPSWSASPDQVSYQWERCAASACSPIAGATRSTLRVTSTLAGQSIRLVVVATFGVARVRSSSKQVRIRP